VPSQNRQDANRPCSITTVVLQVASSPSWHVPAGGENCWTYSFSSGRKWYCAGGWLEGQNPGEFGLNQQTVAHSTKKAVSTVNSQPGAKNSTANGASPMVIATEKHTDHAIHEGTQLASHMKTPAAEKNPVSWRDGR
jgi:hypothetical protein